MRLQAVRRARVVVALLSTCAVTAPAWAQHPHGTPPGLANKGGQAPGKSHSSSGSSSSTSGTGSGSATGGSGTIAAGDTGGTTGVGVTSRVRSIGVWLDDATLMAPGETWVTISAQRWASPIGSGFDGPIVDTVSGLTPRAQLFLSVPYSRVTYTGYPTERELGTVYVGAKIGIRAPGDRTLGLSVAPSVEILSTSAADGTGFSRVNAVVPASAEWRSGRTRIYGSTGYFTRGAVFAGAAVEQTVADDWVVTGTLSQAWSTGDQAYSQSLGLRSTRTDAGGNVVWIASPHLMIFGSVSRTLSALDADSTRYAFSGGASINLDRPGRRTPVAK